MLNSDVLIEFIYFSTGKGNMKVPDARIILLVKILSYEKKILPHPANSICLLMHVASNQIELESPGWSGFVNDSKLDRK